MKKIKQLLLLSLALIFISQSNATCLPGTSANSTDSTCTSIITVPSSNIGTPANPINRIYPFIPRPNMSCTTPWGASVPETASVIAYQTATGTFDPVLQDNNCVYEERKCFGGVLSGSYQYEDCQTGVLNGACGAANGQTYISPNAPAPTDLCTPTTNLDPNDPTETIYIYSSSSGNSIPPLTGNTFNWTCSGQNGGTTASCSANLITTCSGPVSTSWSGTTVSCMGTYSGTVNSGTTVSVNSSTINSTYQGTGNGSLYCASNGTWTGGSGPTACTPAVLGAWCNVKGTNGSPGTGPTATCSVYGPNYEMMCANSEIQFVKYPVNDIYGSGWSMGVTTWGHSTSICNNY